MHSLIHKRGFASTCTAFLGALLLLATTGDKAHAYATTTNMRTSPSGGATVASGFVILSGQCEISTPNNTYDVDQDLRYEKSGVFQNSTYLGSSLAPNTTNYSFSIYMAPTLTTGDYKIFYNVTTQITTTEGGGQATLNFYPDQGADTTFHVQ